MDSVLMIFGILFLATITMFLLVFFISAFTTFYVVESFKVGVIYKKINTLYHI